MADWYCLEITGECRNRFWHGPFATEEEAKGLAYSLYGASYVGDTGYGPGTPSTLRTNAENFFFRRCWWGEGKIRYEGDKNYVFIGTGVEVFARDIEGTFVVTDGLAEQARVEADEAVGNYCAGPFVDDWCSDCGLVQALAEGFYSPPMDYGEGGLNPSGSVDFYKRNTGSAPYLYETLVSPLQAECDMIASHFSVDYDSLWGADGSNTLFAGFGYSRIARITDDPGGFGTQWGYPNTNFGETFYVPDSQVEAWLASGCFVDFTPPDNPNALPWDLFGETFDEPTVYFMGWKWRIELFAQVSSAGIDYGTCYTARSKYDLAYYNQILDNPGYPAYVAYNTIHTGFIPVGSAETIARGWWGSGASVTLPVGFRHINDLDGKVIGDMVAPWALSVNCQLTPVFMAANQDSDCDVMIEGETQAITVIGRCPREAYQRPWPFPGLGSNSNPNFAPWPFTYGQFNEVFGPPNDPVDKTVSELWGWSGNGLSYAELLLLNPTWVVNIFLDNWPPFKRVPQYKKMVEFIRYITGQKSQYQSLGNDPATGWEVYPVPVIVGADGSGFPIYGPPVYRDVPAGKDNQ